MAKINNEGSTMQLWIKGRDRKATQAIRTFVERRVLRKLSRVSKKVRSLAISIRDVNGPRGGIDQVVRVVIRLALGGKIVVRHRTSDALAGLLMAIKRALRAMRREIGRRRSNRRDAYRRNLIGHIWK